MGHHSHLHESQACCNGGVTLMQVGRSKKACCADHRRGIVPAAAGAPGPRHARGSYTRTGARRNGGVMPVRLAREEEYCGMLNYAGVALLLCALPQRLGQRIGCAAWKWPHSRRAELRACDKWQGKLRSQGDP